MGLKLLNTPNWLKDLSGAWVFYTILPKFPFIKAQFSRIARFAPAIGIAIGLFQSSIWIFLNYLNWPKESILLIVLAFGYWITGGLHLDGLMDTADGLAAGKNKLLEAMRDSRIGANGIQVLVLIIFLQIAALLKLENIAPYAIPIATFWSRVSPLWAIENFKYLHKDQKGGFHKKYWKGLREELKPSYLFLFLIYFYLFINPFQMENNLKLIFSTSIAIIPTIYIPNWLGKKLGGHSGDSYGATLVLVETFILIILALIL